MAKDRYKQIIPLLAQNKVRVTSTIGGGHNTGSKHYIGDAVDIDHRTAIKAFGGFDKLQAALPAGWIAVDETTRPAGQKVWGGPHYHLEYRGIGGAIPQQAQLPAINPVNLPNTISLPALPDSGLSGLTLDELAGQNPDGSRNDAYAKVDAILQGQGDLARQNASDFINKTDANLTDVGKQVDAIIGQAQAIPQQAPLTNPDLVAQGDSLIADLTQHVENQKAQALLPPVQPIKEKNLFEQGIGFVGDLANQAGNAVQTEASYRFSPEGALDLFNTGLNTVAQLSPVGMPVGRIKADANPSLTTQAAGGGALQLGANVANFGSGITGQGFNRFQVPNSLQQAMNKLPVTAFGFENLPLGVLPTGNLLRAGKPFANLALDTLAQAGLGLIGTQGDLQQRGVNALLSGGLNLGAAGLGSAASKFLKPATQLDNVAKMSPDELKAQLGLNETQQFNTLQAITPDQPTVLQPLASELPQPKQAFESAQVFKGGVDDIATAKQLADDAVKVRTDLENTLYNTYQVTDPVEAQMALGRDILEAKNTYNQYGEAQALDNLNQKQSLYDNLMTARAQEVEAAKLLNDLDPQGLYRNVKPLPEVNPVKATELAPLPTSAVTPNSVVNQLAPNQMQPIVRPNMAQAVPNVGQLAPNVNQMQPLQPSALGVVDNTKPEIFNQNLLPDPQKAINSLTTEGGDKVALSVQDALNHIDNKAKAGIFTPEQAQLQKDILTQFVESGRRGKTFDMAHRELKEGLGTLSQQAGKVELKTRQDLAPFAITNRTIKPATEVNNLVKQLGTPEAAYQNLVQRAEKYGITPVAGGKTYKANAVKVAQQLLDHPQGRLELTHTYLENHNFKTGGEGTTRGYRLDTIEQAGMGAKEAKIPDDVVYQNQIKAQYDSLQSLANAPNLPDSLKKPLDRVLKKPAPTANDMKSLRKALSNFEELKQFCNLFGLQ